MNGHFGAVSCQFRCRHPGLTVVANSSSAGLQRVAGFAPLEQFGVGCEVFSDPHEYPLILQMPGFVNPGGRCPTAWRA